MLFALNRMVVFSGIAAALMVWSLAGSAVAADKPSKPMPEATEEFIEKGRGIYMERCSFCHGLLGDGEGPAAKYLDPRPRDFTLGTFKFRTTQSGQLPTDTDLFRTVSRGLPGTGMQAFDSDLFKNGLSELERWQVIAFVKTFAQEFEDPELDPIKTGKVVTLPANQPPYSPELVAKGKEAFKKAKCFSCHGMLGRGDGNKEFRKDDWGFPIRIRNVTHPWKIKSGAEVEDIYMRFSTGINGTPMPSFVKSMNEDERWALANYIKSLQHKLTTHQVLKAKPVAGDLPVSPDDAAWDQAAPIDMRLAGQVISAPRWQNPSIEMITVRALFNDKDIAFRIEWDDPFKDTVHSPDKELDTKDITKVGAISSYVEANDMVPRTLATFRDSIALQFPVKHTEGTRKPHFYRGGSSDQVHLWVWKSDLHAQGKTATEEGNARGWKQAVKAQAGDAQQIAGKAKWDQGRWSVVMKRPLNTGDKNDVQFNKGLFIPMAANAWDGSNGEHGLIMSLSTWYYVFMEAPTPISIYIYSVLAFLIIGGLGLWLKKKALMAAAVTFGLLFTGNVPALADGKDHQDHKMKMGSAAVPCTTPVLLSRETELKIGGGLYNGPLPKAAKQKAGMKMGVMPSSNMARGIEDMRELEGAHNVHKGLRGGEFIMVPNQLHHLEVVYTEKCGFQLFLYNAFTEPISTKRFQAFILILPESGDDFFEVMRFLVSAPDGSFLHTPIIRHGKPKSAFEVELYMKFPEDIQPRKFDLIIEPGAM
jgi:DMSO reductase family type II enzyme heme b subunit